MSLKYNRRTKLFEAYGSQFENLEPSEQMDRIREMVSDEEIINELVQYMSTDELADFTETLIRNFDLDAEDDSYSDYDDPEDPYDEDYY